MKISNTLVLLFGLLSAGMIVLVNYACTRSSNLLPLIEGVRVTYTESSEDFPNPERGFYRYSETRTSNFTGLDAATLSSYRTPQQTSSANYYVTSTLVFRYYILDNFTSTAITQDVLDALETDMEAVRAAGVKIIPRFVYTVTSNSGDCPEGFICPPYGDASKTVVINHINQLTPFFQNNSDVIACVQLGFIGTWGEHYYTDYFGDPSGNGGQEYKLTDQNWQDRMDVLAAMLDAVPDDRMVQVRYPQFKQRYVYGVNALLDVDPLTESEAFSATDKARIGVHNDCFLSGSNDIGTYEDYGNNSSPRSSDAAVVNTLRNYMKDDGKFVVIGGETCNDAYSPQNDCEPLGRAQQEFAEMRYSYLNAHYNNEVNNDWETDGCMDNIKRNLGYRFVLQNATFPNQAFRGTNMSINFRLINRGYASPFNERPIQLVLRNATSNDIIFLPLHTDLRRWFSGEVDVNVDISIPSDLTPGDYELLLNMPDNYESISDRPEYSIRLANENLWEEQTGYNNLNHTLSIQ